MLAVEDTELESLDAWAMDRDQKTLYPLWQVPHGRPVKLHASFTGLAQADGEHHAKARLWLVDDEGDRVMDAIKVDERPQKAPGHAVIFSTTLSFNAIEAGRWTAVFVVEDVHGGVPVAREVPFEVVPAGD